MGEEESRFRAEAEPDWGLWAPDRPRDMKRGGKEESRRERGAGGAGAEK